MTSEPIRGPTCSTSSMTSRSPHWPESGLIRTATATANVRSVANKPPTNLRACSLASGATSPRGRPRSRPSQVPRSSRACARRTQGPRARNAARACSNPIPPAAASLMHLRGRCGDSVASAALLLFAIATVTGRGVGAAAPAQRSSEAPRRRSRTSPRTTRRGQSGLLCGERRRPGGATRRCRPG